MPSVEETVKQIVIRIVRKPDLKFSPEATFKDFDADSLDIVQILVALEDNYDIEIDDEELRLEELLELDREEELELDESELLEEELDSEELEELDKEELEDDELKDELEEEEDLFSFRV